MATDRTRGTNTHIGMSSTHIAKVDSTAVLQATMPSAGTRQLVMVGHDREAAAAARARQHVRIDHADPFLEGARLVDMALQLAELQQSAGGAAGKMGRAAQSTSHHERTVHRIDFGSSTSHAPSPGLQRHSSDHRHRTKCATVSCSLKSFPFGATKPCTTHATRAPRAAGRRSYRMRDVGDGAARGLRYCASSGPSMGTAVTFLTF